MAGPQQQGQVSSPCNSFALRLSRYLSPATVTKHQNRASQDAAARPRHCWPQPEPKARWCSGCPGPGLLDVLSQASISGRRAVAGRAWPSEAASAAGAVPARPPPPPALRQLPGGDPRHNRAAHPINVPRGVSAVPLTCSQAKNLGDAASRAGAATGRAVEAAGQKVRLHRLQASAQTAFAFTSCPQRTVLSSHLMITHLCPFSAVQAGSEGLKEEGRGLQAKQQ